MLYYNQIFQKQKSLTFQKIYGNINLKDVFGRLTSYRKRGKVMLLNKLLKSLRAGLLSNNEFPAPVTETEILNLNLWKKGKKGDKINL